MDAGGSEMSWANESLDFIGQLPEDTGQMGRGVKAPRWYRSMTHVNLPEANLGYAILDVVSKAASIQSRRDCPLVPATRFCTLTRPRL
ncbi:MAG: hypothetical protein BMS9Abin37_2618 [Acidobacteriota bacterium]|nr:MAG: hypothetical protein BMS9Abin37_2618 [Acidobacteriota bacterium]